MNNFIEMRKAALFSYCMNFSRNKESEEYIDYISANKWHSLDKYWHHPQNTIDWYVYTACSSSAWFIVGYFDWIWSEKIHTKSKFATFSLEFSVGIDQGEFHIVYFCELLNDSSTTTIITSFHHCDLRLTFQYHEFFFNRNKLPSIYQVEMLRMEEVVIFLFC